MAEDRPWRPPIRPMKDIADKPGNLNGDRISLKSLLLSYGEKSALDFYDVKVPTQFGPNAPGVHVAPKLGPGFGREGDTHAARRQVYSRERSLLARHARRLQQNPNPAPERLAGALLSSLPPIGAVKQNPPSESIAKRVKEPPPPVPSLFAKSAESCLPALGMAIPHAGLGCRGFPNSARGTIDALFDETKARAAMQAAQSARAQPIHHQRKDNFHHNATDHHFGSPTQSVRFDGAVSSNEDANETPSAVSTSLRIPQATAIASPMLPLHTQQQHPKRARGFVRVIVTGSTVR